MELVTKRTRNWEIRDTLKLHFIKGTEGRHTYSPKRIQVMLDNLFTEVMVKGRMAYEMEQIAGLDAHAHLVVYMERLKNGYEVWAIDPEEGSADHLKYFRWENNQNKISIIENGSNQCLISDPFVPFVQYDNELISSKLGKNSARRQNNKNTSEMF